MLVKKYINDNKSKLRVHRKVTCNCLLPTDWVTFMNAAKIRLNCSLISNAAVKETQDKVVVPGLEILSMISSSMEEADERIFVHVKHAL